MKTEWSQEPHLTVRWALFEAMRASDNASVGEYWDVVTENLIRELGFTEKLEALERVDALADGWSSAINRAHGGQHLVAMAYAAEVRRALGDWKRADSSE